MQGRFSINMLAGMNRVRRPTCADGVLHLFSRVVVPADKLEPIDDLDRVELLPDVIPELSEISQECHNEVWITEIGQGVISTSVSQGKISTIIVLVRFLVRG